MLIVECQGGLGNQMFQYACGKALARRRAESLRLDLSHYQRHRNRAFDLDHFRVRYRRATLAERGRFRDLGLRSRILAWLRWGAQAGDAVLLRDSEVGTGLNARALAAKHVCLEGYWQSPRNFGEIEREVREDFILRMPPDPEVSHLMEQVRAQDSVAIHVRRGDYVTDPRARELLGTCTPEYYRGAVECLGGRLRMPKWYVFSDDLAWVRAEFSPGANFTVVAEGRGRSWIDLALMSACRHHVIANSTFSWWGAWLGTLAESLVIAPKKWYANGQVPPKDFYPATWIQL